ncbi:hypothetical protein ACQ86N_37895 [Puia sp. P3]|uniref:hypothetical protein n=1 Tax=Puia sp. P3 TaxID=3423952 RepID=UPI003D672E0E
MKKAIGMLALPLLFCISVARATDYSVARAGDYSFPRATEYSPARTGDYPVDSTIEGRWDLVVHQNDREVPSWLEIIRSGVRTLVGRFVGGGGSARPISKIEYKDGKLHFSIPPQWERSDNDLVVDGTFQGDSLKGTLTNPDGKSSVLGRRTGRPLCTGARRRYGASPSRCSTAKTSKAGTRRARPISGRPSPAS